MDYQIKASLGPHEEFVTYLSNQLKKFNNQHSLPHKQARSEDAIQHVQIMVVDNNGHWQGGITADLYWTWLEIDTFWLPDALRGQGLGRSLLAQVEQIGREQGARKVLLTTFEFQARAFYERYGYRIVGVIEDYPPGTNYYTMVKVLNSH